MIKLFWFNPIWASRFTASSSPKMNYSPRHGRFRALLRKVREEAGLSQEVLAKKLKRPQTFVSKSELGERRIDFLETADFCEACGISIAAFATRLKESIAGEGKERKKRRSPRIMDEDGRLSER